MPVIFIYGVPDKMPETTLLPLMADIKREVSNIEALGLTEDQITIFFPRDHVAAGLGEEIIILVRGLFYKPIRTDAVRAGLAQKLVDRCSSFFIDIIPHSFLVECFLDPPFQESYGFAMRQMGPNRT